VERLRTISPLGKDVDIGKFEEDVKERHKH